jgi:hypothetical protein
VEGRQDQISKLSQIARFFWGTNQAYFNLPLFAFQFGSFGKIWKFGPAFPAFPLPPSCIS